MCRALSQASNIKERREINTDTHIHNITMKRPEQQQQQKKRFNKKR
jgi:hypothetical protein